MLVIETSAAAFALTHFRGLTRMPSSAGMPGVAHFWLRLKHFNSILNVQPYRP